jgi:hypothetical protein
MSAVVAEREAATLEELQEALDQRREQRQNLLAELANLALEEDAARAEFLRTAPTEDPYRVGGKGTQPLKVRTRREKVERQLKDLEATIGTLNGHINREAAIADIENLRTKTAELEKLNKATARRLKEAGAAFEQFILEQWNPYAELLQQRAALRSEVAQAGTLRSVQMLDPEAASAWETVSVAPETPRAPPDAGAFVEMLIEVMLDPGNDGYRGESTIIETNFAASDMRPLPGELRHTRTVVESSNRKYPARLAELLPDLRGQDVRVEASEGVGVGLFGLNPGPWFSGRP